MYFTGFYERTKMLTKECDSFNMRDLELLKQTMLGYCYSKRIIDDFSLSCQPNTSLFFFNQAK